MKYGENKHLSLASRFPAHGLHIRCADGLYSLRTDCCHMSDHRHQEDPQRKPHQLFSEKAENGFKRMEDSLFQPVYGRICLSPAPLRGNNNLFDRCTLSAADRYAHHHPVPHHHSVPHRYTSPDSDQHTFGYQHAFAAFRSASADGRLAGRYECDRQSLHLHTGDRK